MQQSCKYCRQQHTQTECNETNYKTCYFWRTRAYVLDFPEQPEERPASKDAQEAQAGATPLEKVMVVARKDTGKLVVRSCAWSKAKHVEIGEKFVKLVFDRKAVDVVSE